MHPYRNHRIVLLPEIVGFVKIPQQTPLEVTSSFPSEVTVPPVVALVCVISLTLAVVTTGRSLSSAGLGMVSSFLHESKNCIEKIKMQIVIDTLNYMIHNNIF